MTTRYEKELSDIEKRVRYPGKGEIVKPAELEHLNEQRGREKQRDARTKELGNVILMSWAEEPKKWEDAICVALIGDKECICNVQPYETVQGERRLKAAIVVKDGYQKMAEKWALWKWHTFRGSEVDDTDKYIVDCPLPTFEWSKPPERQAA